MLYDYKHDIDEQINPSFYPKGTLMAKNIIFVLSLLSISSIAALPANAIAPLKICLPTSHEDKFRRLLILPKYKTALFYSVDLNAICHCGISYSNPMLKLPESEEMALYEAWVTGVVAGYQGKEFDFYGSICILWKRLGGFIFPYVGHSY